MSNSHYRYVIAFTALFSLVLSSGFATPCYPEERAAWGGNGGWWGGGNHNLYDDYIWRYDDSCPCTVYRHHYHPYCPCKYERPINGRYCYRDRYIAPPSEYEQNETVPGAGLYLDLDRANHHCPR